MRFILVDIHDTDEDHEVGGQDLPYLVTVKVEDGSVEEVLQGSFFGPLMPFNIRPGVRHNKPGNVEFLTFAFEDEIRVYFGSPRPKSRAEQEDDRFFRIAYVMTVGDLKAAIKDLPDDFPIIHNAKDYDRKGFESSNRLGLKVVASEWRFTGPGLPIEGCLNPRWSLRIDKPDNDVWVRVMNGSWRNLTTADFRNKEKMK